jgi:hypothetical protein
MWLVASVTSFLKRKRPAEDAPAPRPQRARSGSVDGGPHGAGPWSHGAQQLRSGTPEPQRARSEAQSDSAECVSLPPSPETAPAPLRSGLRDGGSERGDDEPLAKRRAPLTAEEQADIERRFGPRPPDPTPEELAAQDVKDDAYWAFKAKSDPLMQDSKVACEAIGHKLNTITAEAVKLAALPVKPRPVKQVEPGVVRRKSGTNHFYKMLRERAYELGRIPDVNDVKLLALCANGGLTQGRRGMADAVAYLKKWARKACRAAGGAGAAPQQPAPQPPSPPVAEHGLRQRSAAFLAKLGLINPAMAAQCAAVEVVVVAVTARPGALKQVVCAGGIAGATNFVVRTAEEEDWSD